MNIDRADIEPLYLLLSFHEMFSVMLLLVSLIEQQINFWSTQVIC